MDESPEMDRGDAEPPVNGTASSSWRAWKTNPLILTQILPVLVSLLLLGVVAFQAFVYHRQLRVMRGQLDSMQSTQTMLGEQTEIMKKSLFVNRAYVGVNNLLANISAGQVTITLENVGKLPADKIRVMVRESRRVGNDAVGGSENYYDLGQQLIPGSKLPLVIKLSQFRKEETKTITSRSETLYVSGDITYDDGFGRSDPIKFGFEYLPSPNEGWTPRGELIRQ
ncbi:MAG TPA: hypothetical protein DC054_09300 [Blastocatellia bacterium]|nr:hypothetical protein [Blastocatellia bacterium]